MLSIRLLEPCVSTYSHDDARAGSSGPPFRILLAFSGIREALASGSTFNSRVSECRTAAAALLAAAGRPDDKPILGSVSQEEYGSLGAITLSGEQCRRVHVENSWKRGYVRQLFAIMLPWLAS